MTLLHPKSALCALAAAAWLHGGLAIPANAAAVCDLRCESRREPLGIDVPDPRLSWILASEVRGERQTAYQVVVESGGETVWDSGRVEGDRSVAVRYRGRPLASAMTYAWKVRAWDAAGEPTAWSAPATFVTGMMTPDDWKGRWIGANAERDPASAKVLGFACESARAEETHWVQVDLGITTRIDRIVLHPMLHDDPPAGGRIAGYGFPLRFKLALSSDPAFQDSVMVADETRSDYPNPGWKPVAFDAGGRTGRFVRLTVHKCWGRGPGLPFVYTLGELEVLREGRNLALRAPVSASRSVEGYGWAAAQLTDGAARAPEAGIAAGAGGVRREFPHGALYLRKEIDVAKPAARARVCFCGLGFSELAVDGRKVGDYVIGPGFTTYDKRVQYLMLDVSDQFRQPGRHTLEVTLADGWYALERDPWVHQFEKLPFVDQPKLLLDLVLEHADGTRTTIVSDASWTWSEGEITRSWIAQEDVDRRRSSRVWRPVAAVKGPAGRLVSQREPYNRLVGDVTPVGLQYDAAAQTATWDLGREINGWVRFRAAGTTGTELAVTTIPGTTHGDGVPGCPPRTSRFVLAGAGGKETYEPRFFHAGMRRVRVAGLAAAPEPGDLVARQVSSLDAPAGDFRCSDARLNGLHEAVRRTMVAYTTFLPNDPVREWKAWTQDIENMFWPAVYLFDSQAMYARWQDDLLDGQRADGNFPNVAPGPKFDAYNSPWWGGCAVWLPWEWYLYYGDDALLAESYPAMARYVDYLDRVAKDGLQTWGLGDWLPVEETPVALINTPAHIHYARIVSRAAERLGRAGDAPRFRAMAERVLARFNAAFLDPATGLYGEPGGKVRSGNWTPPRPLEQVHEVWWTGDRPCTQAAQALALGLDLVPAAARPAAERALLREIAAHRGRVSTGFVSTPYLLRVLADLDPEACWTMTTAPDYPSWLGMTVGSASDVMKETWAGGQALMPSLGGNIAAWLYEGLAGIRPDPEGPGFKKILIKPAVAGDLKWVEAHHASPYGRVAVRWKREGGNLELEVTIPPSASATVFVPTDTPDSVTESGRPAAEAEGVRFLRREGGAAIFAVASGRYVFRAAHRNPIR